MPKLPSLTPQKIIKVLEKKGFVLDRNEEPCGKPQGINSHITNTAAATLWQATGNYQVKGSHHIYYHLETKRRVVIPLHKRDLPKGTLLEIIKQAGISKEELRDLL